jgi:hypothetical protein
MLTKYKLPTAYEILQDPPSKPYWKKMVNQAVHEHWEKHLKEEAMLKTSLCYLNLDNCSITRIHTTWNIGAGDAITVAKASIHARLLTQRYPLNSCRTSGKAYGSPCPMCGDNKETVAHFLLRCPKLHRDRQQYLQKLSNILCKNGIMMPASEVATGQLVLDPTHYTRRIQTIDDLLTVSRDLCFKLHHRRSVMMGMGSKYRGVLTK